MHNELASKAYIDNELDKNTILRFNQTLENNLKVSVGDDTFKLTKYNKIQLTDTTSIKYPNNGGYLIQNWNIIAKDKSNNGKISNFIRSTKTNSPTGDSGANSLPPIGNSFVYVETSSNNNGNNVFVRWERMDIIQITKITFYYNRFSSSNQNLRGMGRFRIEILLNDDTWSTR